MTRLGLPWASALASPRSTSVSGLSWVAIRLTSSRLARTDSWASASSGLSRSSARPCARLSCRSTAVRVWPTSSCSSCATRSRSDSCAASTRRAACARSVSRPSSISLKASASSPASEDAPAPGKRSPGRIGSKRRASAASCCSGSTALRTSTMLISVTTPSATIRTSSAASSEMRFGESTRKTVTDPAISTTTLAIAMRQNSGT